MRVLTAQDFIPARSPQKLGPDEIHLWLFIQCSATDQRRTEQELILRGLLGAYLGTHADSFRFDRDVHGKPRLVGVAAESGLQFNLSHTGDYLLIGIGRDVPLGVDLEIEQRERPWLELARRYFSPSEYAALAQLPEEHRARSFLDLWSCKEAVLKALGRGIAFGLHRLEFAVDARGSVDALIRIDAEAGELARWHATRIAPESGLFGAVAWHGSLRPIRAFRFEGACQKFTSAHSGGAVTATLDPTGSSS